LYKYFLFDTNSSESKKTLMSQLYLKENQQQKKQTLLYICAIIYPRTSLRGVVCVEFLFIRLSKYDELNTKRKAREKIKLCSSYCGFISLGRSTYRKSS